MLIEILPGICTRFAVRPSVMIGVVISGVLIFFAHKFYFADDFMTKHY